MTDQPPVPATLTEAALAVLDEPAPEAKVSLIRRFAAAWAEGRIAGVGRAMPPNRPARPSKPDLRPPREMPKRKLGSAAGRVAFVHALAHIELNAIDLAWDIIARFTGEGLPGAFYDDWTRIAAEEAEHFSLLCRRLREMGAAYGMLPAHDGLWEAAEKTADDLLRRLALVPMVLEARGLDTTPAAAGRLRAEGDEGTARLIEAVLEDEISHVAAGVRWFEFLCRRRRLDPVETFHAVVAERFNGRLKPPFNGDARARARFGAEYYQPLAR